MLTVGAFEAKAKIARVDRQTPDPQRLFELARLYGLSAYDATCLELALRRGQSLAACWDGGLSAAAQRAGLYLERPIGGEG